MRNFILIVVTAAWVSVVVNVLMKPNPVVNPENHPVQMVTQVEIDKLTARVSYLESEFEGFIHSDPKVILTRVDRCIFATETNIDLAGCGSFTDWVEIELEAARKAGATKKEISARIDRVYKMAKSGKYYSGYLEGLDKDKKNPNALKEYLDRVKQRIN